MAERLVVATGNSGKLREFRALLADLPFAVVGLEQAGIGAPPETGDSFMANALLKARHAAALCGCAVIAEDSGLEVDALDRAPGIYSARYAGPGAGDAANNDKLIEALAGLPAERRTARYRCAVVYLRSQRLAEGAAPNPPLTAEGVWEGRILEAPRGVGGFGYDPYFWLPELGLTAAELPAAEKNRLSHRGQAMRALRAALGRAATAPCAREPRRR